MNKSKKSIYIVALIICFLICVGILGTLFLLNRDNSRALVRDSESEQIDHRDQGAQNSESAMAQRQNSSISTFHSLADTLKESNSVFDAKRTMLRVVDGATEDVLSQIFRETLEVPSVIGSIDAKYWILSIVLTKLTNVNAAKAQLLIEQLDEQNVVSVLYGVMREWNQVHTDEAIVFLSAINTEIRYQGLRGLIAGGNILSRSELFEIGSELGYKEDYLNDLLESRRLVRQPLSLVDLQTEFESADPNDHSQMFYLRQNAVRYVLAEGLDSLPTVLELFDNVPTDNASRLFGSMLDWSRANLVSDVSEDDPANVFEFVLRLDEDVDVNLLSAVSRSWFASDPDALWNRLQDEDVRNVQAAIIEEVISYWGRREPHIALVSLHHFPAEYHDKAYLDIAQGISRDSPIEALELLPLTSIWPETPENQLSDDELSVRTRRPNFYIERIIADAAEADPIATIEWLNSDASQLDDSTRQQYLDTVFEGWARTDPEAAFEIALQTPLKEGTTALEATVVTWLAYRDVDSAIDLLPRVRESESRIEAYRSVAWQLEEEDRIADAIKLGNQLPELEREEYLQTIAFSVGQRSPFNHLEAGIKELPTKALQSQAARSAIMFSGTFMSAELNDQEKGQLKVYLNDDDKVVVEMMESVDLDKIKEELPKLPSLSE
ncbi:MAG: hypothetical protein F4W92_05775 [Gammaproteobacteria bacterium]|nr:hypothetical protein [Gammaproteobacteria bacterium]